MTPPALSVRPAVVVEWENGRAGRVLDDVAQEEPLEIRVGDELAALVMRTPGNDRDLAFGFLYSEGVISCRDDVARCAAAASPDGRPMPNTVCVELRPGALFDPSRFTRSFPASSACGVCGRTSIAAVRARRSHPLNAAFRVASAALSALPDSLRDAQPTFARTGGLHAAALFDARGAIDVVREDIGRHNAVDKVIGAALGAGDRIPLEERGLLVSGRGGFEIVQKAIVAGIPIVACISAPSSLAVQLAREAGQTLVGFLRGNRFVVYAGEDRIEGTSC